MSSEWAIHASGLSKCYTLFDRPQDRLKQMLMRGRRKYYREFWALRGVNLRVRHGEVLGVVGRNGAGKSTLLQLICGTLTPSSGSVDVNGRVAALLELGAGFNPEFSGRENAHLTASLLGLTAREIAERIDAIIDFSGIREFIDQPVKTYSSGMFVRLAFSVATSVDPDILVIDEALSVGDGEFARRSFDRIMSLKAAGKTILFCSHSLYQIEAICDRAIWLDHGTVKADGSPGKVTVAYDASFNQPAPPEGHEKLVVHPAEQMCVSLPVGHARLRSVDVCIDGESGQNLCGTCGTSTLSIKVDIISDPVLPVPTIGVVISGEDGRAVSSAGTQHDNVPLTRNAAGEVVATLVFPGIPLLKGRYRVDVYALCENAIHIYDQAIGAVTFEMRQPGRELGVVILPHRWEVV